MSHQSRTSTSRGHVTQWKALPEPAPGPSTYGQGPTVMVTSCVGPRSGPGPRAAVTVAMAGLGLIGHGHGMIS